MAKRIFFLGDSLDRIRAFLPKARNDVGTELRRVQLGIEPMDWKPMKAVGAGVLEIRVRDESGIFRVIYLAKRPEGIYVLNAFQKKTQTTAKRDLDLASRRLKDI